MSPKGDTLLGPGDLLNPYVVWYNKTDNSNYEESVEP